MQIGKRVEIMISGSAVGEEKEVHNEYEWLIDLGLVYLYSLFILGCFFFSIFHKDWGLRISLVLTILISACIGFVHHDLKRTLTAFFVSSLLGIILSFIPVVFLFPSSAIRHMGISGIYSQEQFWALIPFFVIILLILSILGAIVGNYIAERTAKGEKRLTLKCPDCGTWNEQKSIQCSYCGKKLGERRKVAEKTKR